MYAKGSKKIANKMGRDTKKNGKRKKGHFFRVPRFECDTTYDLHCTLKVHKLTGKRKKSLGVKKSVYLP